MSNGTISPSCQKSIELIDEAFKSAKQMLDVAEQRVKTAETKLTEIQSTVSEEIQKSYKAGYEAGLKNSGTNENPEGGPKLVYTQN